MVSRRDDPIAGAASSNETGEGWRLRQRRPRERRQIHTTISRSTANRVPRRQHEFRPERVSWSGFCTPCPSRHIIKRSRARTTNAVKTNTRIWTVRYLNGIYRQSCRRGGSFSRGPINQVACSQILAFRATYKPFSQSYRTPRRIGLARATRGWSLCARQMARGSRYPP